MPSLCFEPATVGAPSERRFHPFWLTLLCVSGARLWNWLTASRDRAPERDKVPQVLHYLESAVYTTDILGRQQRDDQPFEPELHRVQWDTPCEAVSILTNVNIESTPMAHLVLSCTALCTEKGLKSVPSQATYTIGFCPNCYMSAVLSGSLVACESCRELLSIPAHPVVVCPYENCQRLVSYNDIRADRRCPFCRRGFDNGIPLPPAAKAEGIIVANSWPARRAQQRHYTGESALLGFVRVLEE